MPINFLLTRGQMIKVMSMIYRKCRAEGYAVPAKRGGAPEDTFEGATVLDPSCASARVLRVAVRCPQGILSASAVVF